MLFDETVCVTGVRESGRKIAAPALPARVIDDGVPSDAVDGYLAPNCDRFTFFVKASEWPEVTPPHIGDIVTREDNSRFKVTRVARLADCFSLNARSA